MQNKQDIENVVVEDIDQTEEIDSLSDSQLPLFFYLRTLIRKAPLIVCITFLTTLGGYFFSYLTDKSVYSGFFELLVEPLSSEEKISDASTIARSGGVPNENLLRLDYPTQIAILKSPTMLEDIAQEIHDRYPFHAKKDIQDALRANLEVRRLQEGESRYDTTKIIRVNYAARDPQLVELILSVTSEKYLDYSRTQRDSNIKAGVDFINSQITPLLDRINDLQLQIQVFQDRYKIIDPNTRTQDLLNQLYQTNNQKVEIENQLKELRTLASQLQQQIELNPQEALVTSELTGNAQRQNLLQQIQQVENQIAIFSSLYTSNHPQLEQLKNQRENLLKLLDQKNLEILGRRSYRVQINPKVSTSDSQNSIVQNLSGQLIETTNQIKVLEVRYQSLKETIERIEKTVKQFPDVIRQYKEIQRELELNNNTLNQLLAQRQTLQVEASEKEFPWQLVTEANVPTNRNGEFIATTPDPKKKILAGFMAGFVLSCVGAILIERGTDIFYSSQDIEDIIPLKFLGEVLISSQTKSPPKSILGRLFGRNDDYSEMENLESWLEVESGQLENRYAAEKSVRNSRFNDLPIRFWLLLLEIDCLTGILFLRESLKLEGFDLLYSRLRFLYRDSPVRSVVVSSIESGDGQSLVAFNLAQSALTKNERVLLVDLNGYKPKYYNWSNSDEDEDLLNQLETTWSKKMESVLEKIHTKYDLVVYDTPHFFESSNIKFLANHTDGFLMVARIAKTSQSLFKQAINQIEEFNLPTLGVVATVFKISEAVFEVKSSKKSSVLNTFSKKKSIEPLTEKPPRIKKQKKQKKERVLQEQIGEQYF